MSLLGRFVLRFLVFLHGLPLFLGLLLWRTFVAAWPLSEPPGYFPRCSGSRAQRSPASTDAMDRAAAAAKLRFVSLASPTGSAAVILHRRCCERTHHSNEFSPVEHYKPRWSRSAGQALRFLHGVERHCSTADCCYAVGRVNKKVEPWASSLSARMEPPWASMMCLAMARPRPVPPDSRERALSTR